MFCNSELISKLHVLPGQHVNLVSQLAVGSVPAGLISLELLLQSSDLLF